MPRKAAALLLRPMAQTISRNHQVPGPGLNTTEPPEPTWSLRKRTHESNRPFSLAISRTHHQLHNITGSTCAVACSPRNGAWSPQISITTKKMLHPVYLEVIPRLHLFIYQPITCCTHPPYLLSDAEISCLRSQISIFDLAAGWDLLPRGA